MEIFNKKQKETMKEFQNKSTIINNPNRTLRVNLETLDDMNTNTCKTHNPTSTNTRMEETVSLNHDNTDNTDDLQVSDVPTFIEKPVFSATMSASIKKNLCDEQTFTKKPESFYLNNEHKHTYFVLSSDDDDEDEEQPVITEIWSHKKKNDTVVEHNAKTEKPPTKRVCVEQTSDIWDISSWWKPTKK
jgi:hypothetical protein